MAGVLNRTTNGLLLGETGDVYPNGWTFSHSGTANSTCSSSAEVAHSGSNSFDFLLADDWANGAYVTLAKSVTIPIGGNPFIRMWRGPNCKGAMIDDFLGSSVNGGRWGVKAGKGTPPIANSLAQMNSPTATYGLLSVHQIQPSGGKVRFAFRIMADPTLGGSNYFFVQYPSGSYGGLQFGVSSLGVGQLQPYNGGTYAYDAVLHVYDMEWSNEGAYPGTPDLWQTDFWKDGTLCSGSPGGSINDTAGYHFEIYGQNQGCTCFIDWMSMSLPAAYLCSLTLGVQNVFVNSDPTTEYGSALAVANNFLDETNGWVAVTVTGAQTLTFKIFNNSGYQQGFPAHIFLDDVIVMADQFVKVLGLLGGQKIEFYNLSDTLLYTVSATQTGQTLTLVSDIRSVLTSAAGLQGYFKIYDTDGITLLLKTANTGVFGGDVWTWVPNKTEIGTTTSHVQIYTSTSGLSPLTAAAVATLTDLNGVPLSGKTISFATANLGTCNPSSAVTDVNGHASTTYTAGSVAGLGAVQPSFAGDATYGPSTGLIQIDVYASAVQIDATKDFQVFIAGQSIQIESGNYLLSTAFQPQGFEVDTPIMTYSIGGWWLVQIYRQGVLEFTGRVLGRERTSSTNPLMKITGVDNKVMLQRRVANAAYTDEPKNLVTTLLNTYPCGITVGTLGTYGSSVVLNAGYEILFDALAQIQTITGWLYRLNANGTLDFASSFGTAPAVNIILGTNAILTDFLEDWSQLDTSVTAVGAGTGNSLLVSTKSDAASQLLYGLIETVSLQKSIVDSSALALAAANLLAQKDITRVTIVVDFADTYPTGTYNLWDVITVTDPTTGLSGTYQVTSIKRDLTDANYAELTLTNNVVTIADVLAMVRSNVKDLSL